MKLEERYDRLGRKVEDGDFLVYIDQGGFHCLLVSGRDPGTGQWFVSRVTWKKGDDFFPISKDIYVTRETWLINDALLWNEFLVVREFDGTLKNAVAKIK